MDSNGICNHWNRIRNQHSNNVPSNELNIDPSVRSEVHLNGSSVSGKDPIHVQTMTVLSPVKVLVKEQ